MDFPIKNCDFPWQNVSSPEGSIGTLAQFSRAASTVVLFHILIHRHRHIDQNCSRHPQKKNIFKYNICTNRHINIQIKGPDNPTCYQLL